MLAFVTSSRRLSRLHVYNRECGNGRRHNHTLDITNGASGEIVGIVLHEDEPLITHWQGALVKLTSCLYPRQIFTDPSIQDWMTVVPVEPSSTTYRMTMTTKRGKKGPRTVQSRQFPITAAYAFTDYRSQGRTITYVLVDIQVTPPPRDILSLFNFYVALSRSFGKDTIRLLRDFDDDIFRKSNDPVLFQEVQVERLEKMYSETEG